MHDYFPPWTNERETELKRWYVYNEAGVYLSNGAIAKKMGVTRGAVIGKAKRLGLVRGNGTGPVSHISVDGAVFDPSNIGRARASGPAAPSTARPWSPPRPRVPVEVLRDPVSTEGRSDHAVSFEGLTDKICHYPIGAPRSKSFHFCGAMVDSERTGYYYCKFHYKVCYTPVKARRGDNRPHYRT